MYLTLVKDKVPETQADKSASYAVAQSDDLYVNLLTEKFVSAASSFLNGGGLDALIDTQLIIEGLISVNKDKYEEAYNQVVESQGKYEKRIMAVHMNSDSAAEVETTIADASEPDSLVS